MSQLDRLRAAIAAGISTYRQDALAPTDAPAPFSAEWESYAARYFRYVHYSHYYFNTAYSGLQTYASQLRGERGLYRFVRALYNPVFREVELLASKTYGGRLDMESMQKGAVPLVYDSDAVVEAVRALWVASKFATKRMLFARTAFRLGDCAIKVVDDPGRESVRLEFYHPGIVYDVTFDSADNPVEVVFQYKMTDPDTAAEFTYTEVVDAEKFATYRDGELFAFPWNTDERGVPQATWPNPYGFVPVTIAKAKDIGFRWGAVPFHAVIDKVDQLNDIASLTFDQIRKTIVPLWYFAGVKSARQLAADEPTNDQERNSARGVYGPAGSIPHPLVAPIDIGAALKAIDSLLMEIEADLPELSLHRIRQHGNLTAPGIRSGYDDAIKRIDEARGQLDGALENAMKQALAIGGWRGYPGYEGFDLDDYTAGINLSIGDRPIILDSLSKKETLSLMVQTDAPLDVIWRELGMSERDITRGIAELVQRERTVAADVVRALSASVAGEEA